MASQKEELATALRAEQKKTKELTEQLDEVRKLNPVVHKSAVTKKKAAVAATAAAAAASGAASGAATGNMVYKCPKCMRFSSDQYHVMEDHFDLCLDADYM
ncbi:unnamed protein product [Plutella xylostella]|uniref:(diamondback moth) hypothetical protein n=2 Tax=Plutella xylostella TaxID=51655 RepID=A0A8S4G5U7_PLUXY|nr:unnamed protein product [Plutella xylostella]